MEHSSIPVGKLPGKLIIFEGPDGVGKTTLSQQMQVILEARGQQCKWLSFPGREDGSLGRAVYDLHHEPERFGVHSMTATAKQALHIAAHLDAIEYRIKPWLAAGIHVILDRFWWSTWVYGITSGLVPELLQALITAEKICWGNAQPSLAFLVETDAPRDRENEDIANWQALKQAYRVLVHQEQENHPIVLLLNTSTLEEATQRIADSLQSLP